MMASNLANRIKSTFGQMSEGHKKIASAILDNEADLENMTISEVAKRIGSSTASLSRFVKELGYNSFPEFRSAIMEDADGDVPNARDISLELNGDRSYHAMKNSILRLNQASLQSTFDLIDDETLDKTTDFITQSANLAFFGIAGSSVVAMNGYFEFIRTPLNCLYTSDFHLQLMQAVKLTKHDCAILISQSGQDKDAIRIAETIKEAGCPLILLTSFKNSRVAGYADLTLISHSQETKFRKEALHTLITQISIMDLLFFLSAVKLGSSLDISIAKARRIVAKTRL